MKIVFKKDGRRYVYIDDVYAIDMNKAPKNVGIEAFVTTVRTLRKMYGNAKIGYIHKFDILDDYAYDFHYQTEDPFTGIVLAKSDNPAKLYTYTKDAFPGGVFDLVSNRSGLRISKK